MLFGGRRPAPSVLTAAGGNCHLAQVTHPYDIGDIIIFNGSWHRVEEVSSHW